MHHLTIIAVALALVVEAQASVLLVAQSPLTKTELDWKAKLENAETRTIESRAAVKKEIEKAGGQLFEVGRDLLIACPSLARHTAKLRRLSAYLALADRSGPAPNTIDSLPSEVKEIAQQFIRQMANEEGYRLEASGDTAVAISIGMSLMISDGERTIHVLLAANQDPATLAKLKASPLKVSQTKFSLEPMDRAIDHVSADHVIGPTFYTASGLSDRAEGANLLSKFWSAFGEYEEKWASRLQEARTAALEAVRTWTRSQDWMSAGFAGRTVSDLPNEMRQQILEKVSGSLQRYGFRNESELNSFLQRGRIAQQKSRIFIGFGTPGPNGSVGFSGF